MTQLELNKQLYEAVTAPQVDLSRIDNLLKLGADPLGAYDEDDLDSFVLDELFCESQDDTFAERLPSIVALFLDYDIDVEKSELDALYCLTWIRNEFGIQALKSFLDNGLSIDYTESFFEHLFGDIQMFEFPQAVNMDGWEERFEYAVKMVMLSASYERIVQGSQFIRELIETENNNSAILERFRDWKDYRCEVSVMKSSDAIDCLVRLIDLKSSGILWSFKLK